MARKSPQAVKADHASEQLTSDLPSPTETSADATQVPGLVTKMVHGNSYKTMYSNYSKVGISQRDLSITFG